MFFSFSSRCALQPHQTQPRGNQGLTPLRITEPLCQWLNGCLKGLDGEITIPKGPFQSSFLMRSARAHLHYVQEE